MIAKLFPKVMGRRKRKNPNRIRKIIYTLDSSSSDQSSCTGNKEKRQCTQNKDKVNTSEVNSDLSNYMNNSSQYTQMTSSPNMAYQQNYSPVYPSHPLPPYPPPPPMSPGIDSVLKEICQKLSNVETKLTKLDKIEERLEIMDKKFKTVDTDINSCNQRLNTLEHSAQFLSNVHDDHKALKLKLDKITSGIESTKTESKNFNDKLLDIEVQSLEKNLLFFAIDEHTVVENNPEHRGVQRE